MASVLVQVADAIRHELTLGTSFVLAIDPKRSYADWDEELTEEAVLRVDVVPVRAASADLQSRGYAGYECEIDIGVRYRFPQEEREQRNGRIAVDAVDELVELVEQIHEHFVDADNSGRRLAQYTSAAWQSTDIRASYVRDMLRNLGQFVGIVRVTYQAEKAL